MHDPGRSPLTYYLGRLSSLASGRPRRFLFCRSTASLAPQFLGQGLKTFAAGQGWQCRGRRRHEHGKASLALFSQVQTHKYMLYVHACVSHTEEAVYNTG